MIQPSLPTDRLTLRPFTLDDAAAVQALAGRREIADTTISVPHPCSEQQARDWLASHAAAFALGQGAGFAIELNRDQRLIGAVGIRDVSAEHQRGELGMWIGVEWWGHGFATEAARAVVAFGFKQLGLNRIYAHHMVRNPASGKVLVKVGMRREGLLRQPVRKWGKFEDVVLLAILRQDWQGAWSSPGVLARPNRCKNLRHDLTARFSPLVSFAMDPDADLVGLKIALAHHQHGVDLGFFCAEHFPVNLVSAEIGLRSHHLGAQLADELFGILHQVLVIANGQHPHLLRRQPEREVARIMLDQEADEPLMGPQRRPMNAKRSLLGVIAILVLSPNLRGTAKST